MEIIHARLSIHATGRRLLHATGRRAAVTERSAGTTTIHFQKLKNIPVEVYPLGVIVAFMLSYGTYAMGKALLVGDPTLRNHRQPNQKGWEESDNER